MKRGKTYEWFPFFVDKWIFGSTRIELKPAERAVWIDLMALAAKDDGYVRANETTPYPIEQLAGMFCVSVKLLETTIEKCIQYNKLERDESGILYLNNWGNYALTKRHKRRVMSEYADIMSGSADTYTETDTENKQRRYTDIMTAWNKFAAATNLPQIKAIAKGSTRERHLNARLGEKDFDFDGLLEKAGKQSFLLGDNKSGWTCTFDWLLNPTNYQKVMEENYLRSGKARPSEYRASSTGRNTYKPSPEEQASLAAARDREIAKHKGNG